MQNKNIWFVGIFIFILIYMQFHSDSTIKKLEEKSEQLKIKIKKQEEKEKLLLKKIDSLSSLEKEVIKTIETIKEKEYVQIKVVDSMPVSKLQQYFTERYSGS